MCEDSFGSEPLTLTVSRYIPSQEDALPDQNTDHSTTNNVTAPYLRPEEWSDAVKHIVSLVRETAEADTNGYRAPEVKWEDAMVEVAHRIGIERYGLDQTVALREGFLTWIDELTQAAAKQQAERDESEEYRRVYDEEIRASGEPEPAFESESAAYAYPDNVTEVSVDHDVADSLAKGLEEAARIRDQSFTTSAFQIGDHVDIGGVTHTLVNRLPRVRYQDQWWYATSDNGEHINAYREKDFNLVRHPEMTTPQGKDLPFVIGFDGSQHGEIIGFLDDRKGFHFVSADETDKPKIVERIENMKSMLQSLGLGETPVAGDQSNERIVAAEVANDRYQAVHQDGYDQAIKDYSKDHGGKTLAGRLLLDAAKTVSGDRQDLYGKPERNFDVMAELISTYLTAKIDEIIDGDRIKITATDVSALMILFKVARVARMPHRDNWLDIAGYAGCGHQSQVEETGVRD